MTAAIADAPPQAATAPSAEPTPEPTERLKQSAKLLAVAAIDLAAGRAVEMVDGVSGRLEDITDRVGQGAGVGVNAAIGAGKAWLAGNNPVWGAVKGGWAALGTGAKVGIILGLILLGLLSPVALLVALVVLLVVALVRAGSS